MGIAKSIRTISGWILRARATASWPFLASPTTSMSGSAIRRALSPWRTRVWSSASRTEIFAINAIRLLVIVGLVAGGGNGVDPAFLLNPGRGRREHADEAYALLCTNARLW